jgi:hypothetical protein
MLVDLFFVSSVVRDKIGDPLFEFSLDLFICIGLLLLDIGEHDALFVHEFHVVVCGVGMFGNLQAYFTEIGHRLGSFFVINDVAIDHEDNFVEFHENLTGRLMDCRYDRSPQTCQLI